MRNAINVVCITLILALIATAKPNPAPKVSPAIQKHSSFKIAKALVAPVVHPKRTAKQILGSVLFASEPAVDVAHLTFAALDAAFSANIKPYEPIHYLAIGSAKADFYWEAAESYFFGSSN